MNGDNLKVSQALDDAGVFAFVLFVWRKISGPIGAKRNQHRIRGP